MGLFTRPGELLLAYADGYEGCICRPEARHQLRESGFLQPVPQHVAASDTPDCSLNWMARQRYDPGVFALAQTRGSCAAWSARCAIDTARCCELERGDTEQYLQRTSMIPLYAARGWRGEGADPADIARAASEMGCLYERQYPFADLRNASERIAEASFLRRAGVLAEMRQHRVATWLEISTLAELHSVLGRGGGVAFGFTRAWSSRADRQGITHITRGGWNHAQAVTGYDLRHKFYDCDVYHLQNSWGAWNQEPRWMYDGDWPVGSYMITRDEMSEILDYGNCYGYLGIAGQADTRPIDWDSLGDTLG